MSLDSACEALAEWVALGEPYYDPDQQSLDFEPERYHPDPNQYFGDKMLRRPTRKATK